MPNNIEFYFLDENIAKIYLRTWHIKIFFLILNIFCVGILVSAKNKYWFFVKKSLINENVKIKIILLLILFNTIFFYKISLINIS